MYKQPFMRINLSLQRTCRGKAYHNVRLVLCLQSLNYRGQRSAQSGRMLSLNYSLLY